MHRLAMKKYGHRLLTEKLEKSTFHWEPCIERWETCKLPKKSEIINKKGYQEVHIPPLKPMPPGPNEKVVKVADMPDWSHKAFDGMTQLNRVQSKVYECAFQSAENMLICAPTGAGKTNVAMLTMLREIGLHRKADGSIDVYISTSGGAAGIFGKD